MRCVVPWVASTECGARRLVITRLAAMPMYYHEGAVVESAQPLEGRGAPKGHVTRLGAKPGARPKLSHRKALYRCRGGARGRHPRLAGGDMRELELVLSRGGLDAAKLGQSNRSRLEEAFRERQRERGQVAGREQGLICRTSTIASARTADCR